MMIKKSKQGLARHHSESGFAAVLIMLILVGIVAIVGASYFFGVNKIGENVNMPTPTSVAVVQPTTDPTANWKTYSSSSYTFKYPSNAKLEVQQDGVVKIVFMGQKQIDSGRTQTSLFDGYGFFVAKSNENVTLEEGYAKRVESFNNVCDPQKMGRSSGSQVDGIQALRYEVSCLGDYTTYLTKNNGQFYELNELYVGEPNDQIGYRKITDQILSTFKFTK